ncbi:MAG: efflux RND transporter periplasmic adaptor subunit, partial [Candidatus Paceibacterales bacterium]
VILALSVGGYFLFFNKKAGQQTLTVHAADFLQQVSASGTVVPEKSLDLSFEQPGRISSVRATVGDNVKMGQLLVSQDTGQLGAEVSQMQAGIDLQQAKLDQLLAGASSQDIQVSQAAVDYANQNVSNAYVNAQTSLNTAYTAITNAYTTSSYIQTTYFISQDQASFQADVQDAKNSLDLVKNSTNQSDIDSALVKMQASLNSVYDNLVIIRQKCDLDAYIITNVKVSLADKSLVDTQKTNINSALTTLSGIQTSIASYKSALAQAQDALASKKSPARPSDIAVYQAQIEQAKASLQSSLAQLNKQRIYSPIDGVVTTVNAKVGNIMSPADIAVSVISANSFQIESYIPQINIALIKVANPAQVTLDAYGSNTFFDAKVISIDPAETIKDGVSTYKVTLEFTDATDSRIKSGLTGNIIITTEKKSNVIAVPQGIVSLNNGQSFINVKNGNTIEKRLVQTGDVASNGNVEITSGLVDGDVVVLK